MPLISIRHELSRLRRRWVSVAVATAVVLGGLGQLAPAAPAATATQLTRYPYLTDVVTANATVNFATVRSATTAFVRYGTGGNCTATRVNATRTSITVAGQGQYQWSAKLTNLTPDTPYCYRVYLGSAGTDLLGTDPSPTFLSQLPSSSTAPYSFAVIGDWGQAFTDGLNPDQANLLAKIAASPARFVLSTGDIGYPAGSQTNYGDLQHTGRSVSGVFGPQFWARAGARLPMFPAVGNHAPDAVYTLNWPSATAAATSGGAFSMAPYPSVNGSTAMSYPNAWYAFDAGPARYYVLDAAWDDNNLGTGTAYSNDYAAHWTPSSAQYSWLAADLAAHPSALKFAFFHYPLYSDQAANPSDTYLQGTSSLEGLLARYGVDIAFTGHAHIYQRNYKPGPNSLVSYVTGGGGATLQTVGTRGCSSIDAYAIGWKNGTRCGAAPVPTSADQVYHYLLVTVDGTRVTVTPTDELGRTFDVKTYDFGTDGAGAPSAPDMLQATPNGATRIDLSWGASSDDIGVNSYTVTRDGTAIASVPGWTTSYRDTSVPAGGTPHTYTVVANDGNGLVSPPSPEAVAATSGTIVEYRFQAAADATLDSSAPDTPLGGATRLLADNDPVKRFAVRFTVTGTTGCQVTTARLRLQVGAGTTDGSPKGGDVYRLPPSSFTEATVTWNTAPVPTSSEPVAAFPAAPSGATVDADVTDAVSGDGAVDLLVRSPSPDGVAYYSREYTNASRRPELIVTCTT